MSFFLPTYAFVKKYDRGGGWRCQRYLRKANTQYIIIGFYFQQYHTYIIIYTVCIISIKKKKKSVYVLL